MLMCVGACMCVLVYALRIVSRDKILHFTNTFIIIIIIIFIQMHNTNWQHSQLRFCDSNKQDQ